MLQFFYPFLLLLTTNFYSLQANYIDGNPIDFTAFQGKKVLIVNTASGSEYASQYDSLETLYQQYKDSLVIIAFPSNSFGHEENTNADDLGYDTRNSHTISYILGELVEVSGNNTSPVFQWLNTKDLNGFFEQYTENDFQKYLVDTQGNLVAVFAASVNPTSDVVKGAIEQGNY